MSDEKDKLDPEEPDAKDSGLEEIEVEEAWYDAPSLESDKGFDIVMEIEREENWPPPPPRKKV
jgi:hypothetical protein